MRLPVKNRFCVDHRQRDVGPTQHPVRWLLQGRTSVIKAAEVWRWFSFSFRLQKCILLIFLLLRWHYSPKQTFPSSMHFSHSALFFYLSLQFVILRLWIPVFTQFHHLFFGRPLSRLPWGLLLNTSLAFLLLSILLTWLIQFGRLNLTNESISKSANIGIDSLLYSSLQI